MKTATLRKAKRETMSLEEFFEVLGYNRTSGYALAREDRLPVPVIRIGRRMLVSRRAVDDLLNRKHEDAPGEHLPLT